MNHQNQEERGEGLSAWIQNLVSSIIGEVFNELDVNNNIQIQMDSSVISTALRRTKLMNITTFR